MSNYEAGAIGKQSQGTLIFSQNITFSFGIATNVQLPNFSTNSKIIGYKFQSGSSSPNEIIILSQINYHTYSGGSIVDTMLSFKSVSDTDNNTYTLWWITPTQNGFNLS